MPRVRKSRPSLATHRQGKKCKVSGPGYSLEFQNVAMERMREFLAEQLPLGAIAAVKAIEVADETFLTAQELSTMGSPIAAVRQASGAARRLARQLLEQFGIDARDIPRCETRAPLWPAGVIGSLAHDGAFAAAVVARLGKLKGIGIDIEPRVVLELHHFNAGEESRHSSDLK